MTDDAPLAAGFEDASEARWMELVVRALEGAPVSSLTTRTPHGVEVKPLYRETDWPSAVDPSGFPGAAPFTRGARPVRDRFAPWDIRQEVAHPSPETANRLALEALEGGAMSIDLAVDAAGAWGVPIDPGAIATALRDVRLDLAPASFTLRGFGAWRGAPVLASAIRGLPGAGAQALAFGADPIGDFATTGAADREPAVLLSEAAALAAALGADFPAASILRADGARVHEAGGTEVQELAFLIASGVAYARAQIEAGADPAAALTRIEMRCAVGADAPVEIAKLRAARRLWAEVCAAFAAPSAAAGMRLSAVTARRMMTRRDPWVNLLRTTAACFAAGVAGADSLSVRPFTDSLGRPAPLARRLARNTQIIAQEEVFLGRVADPAGGAWAFERLTEDLAQAAWTLFQEIEREGGVLAALVAGGFQAGVAHARDDLMKRVRTRRTPVTGVSDFPDLDLPEPETEGGWPAAAPAPASAVLRGAPLVSMRTAEPFETLRDRGDALLAAGRPPRILLVALGPPSEHGARLTFAQNAFSAGGVRTAEVAVTPAEAADAFAASNTQFVCLCASDARYAQEAAAAAAALSGAGAMRVYLAGRPGPEEAGLRSAGVTHFIHVGVDIAAMLEDLLTEASAPRSGD